MQAHNLLFLGLRHITQAVAVEQVLLRQALAAAAEGEVGERGGGATNSRCMVSCHYAGRHSGAGGDKPLPSGRLSAHRGVR